MPSEAKPTAPGGPALRGVVVIGTAAAPGRLSRSLGALGEALLADPRVGGAELLDLSSGPLEYCDGRPAADYDERTRAAVEAALDADFVVLGSPVYRGTYTGALKNYLDLLPLRALRDKPVGIVAIGAGDHHYLGVEVPLRGVLAWFGALAAPNGVYLSGASFDRGRELREEAREELRQLAATLVGLAGRPEPYGPPPLAARWEGPNPTRGDK